MKISRRIILTILGLTWCLGLHAQPIIVTGAGKPDLSLRGEWYLDTVAHTSYRRNIGEWNSYLSATQSIRTCGTMIILKSDRHELLLDREGGWISQYATCDCFGKMARLESALERRYYLDGTLIGIASGTQNKQGWEEDLMVDTLLGAVGFCATLTILGPRWHGDKGPRENAHARGILGTDGNWRIEPMFDEPFHFQDGMAEVLYYGQKRKINEKGEWVEE